MRRGKSYDTDKALATTISTKKPFRAEIATSSGITSYIHGKTKSYVISQAKQYQTSAKIFELKNNEYIFVEEYHYE